MFAALLALFLFGTNLLVAPPAQDAADTAPDKLAKVSVEKIEQKKAPELEKIADLTPEEQVKQQEKEKEAEKELLPPTALTSDDLVVYTAKTLSTLSVDHATTINFAMTGGFEGHFKLYAELIRNGILACFNRINFEGGIFGKKLRLICVNDDGDPSLTQKITNILRKKHNVTMHLGSMGTRGILQILPLIKSKKIAMFFPWGGSQALRDPALTNIVNGLGELEPQLRELVLYTTQVLRFKKIALFHSDGTFNSTAMQKVRQLLKEIGIEPVSIDSYNRATMDINSPAERIIASDPKIVICFGSSRPVSKLISRFFELGHYGTTFIGIDSTMFVSTILKEKGAAYSYTSTVPDPVRSIAPIVQRFRHDMEATFPHEIINILSLSYYIHASIIVKALKLMKHTHDQQDLLRTIETFKHVDLDGFALDFNPANRHAYPHMINIVKG